MDFSVDSTEPYVHVPYYRYAYQRSLIPYPGYYKELKETLPGFRLGTGMACSLGALFDLELTTVGQFMPDLFTRILPTVRDEMALVIALYLRTGFTDSAAMAEKSGRVALEARRRVHKYKSVLASLECALKLEQTFLREAGGFSYSRIVWMLVTDSFYTKQWIPESYGSKFMNQTVSLHNRTNTIAREIVTTTSRGVQTRPARNPSTADFAEAFIDWYLIGESDVVVTNSYRSSFGSTAALRTARPFYVSENCTELPGFGPPMHHRAPQPIKRKKALQKQAA